MLVALLAVPISAAEDFVPNMPLDASDRGYRLWQIDMAPIAARIGRYDAARRIIVLEAEDGNTLALGKRPPGPFCS